MTLKNIRAPLLSNDKLCDHFTIRCEFKLELHSGNGDKFGFDLCDLDFSPLTLTFCMDITSVIGNNSGKFHDDKMMGT